MKHLLSSHSSSVPRQGARHTVRRATTLAAFATLALLGACAANPSGYGVGPQAERAAMAQQQSNREPAPDTPGMYLGLIDQMQSQGLYFASLAHIDAYEKQYGASPDTILLRADALRMTDQTVPAASAYEQLLNTPLAAAGYRGLGLIAGGAGDFARAAQQLEQAAQRTPTNASTLSDLGYARLRNGDVAGARVPLLKAVELDQNNTKILSNVALYLLASGDQAQALALMNRQKFGADVRTAIRADAARVAAAGREQMRGQTSQQQSGQPAAGTVASVQGTQGIEPAPRLLQRFSQ
ncbi:Flp pilus assembly protein TadD [Paraburkholderia sp. GAS199]|uniref:tetratricopeptide repeat protein n=1 Tax=Paraburkholderia sp. GAS199 TaxID=3035126 RepID=UPI003D1BDFDC